MAQSILNRFFLNIKLKKSEYLITAFIIVLLASVIVWYLLRPVNTNKQAEWIEMGEYMIKARPPAETSNYALPKIIWSYWHDENIPTFVNNVLKQRAKILSGWEIKILNEKTIREYFSDLPPNYDKMIQSHKSDWLRLALLKNYGGCWLDATVIVNSLSAFDDIYLKSTNAQSEFTGFYTPMSIIDSDPTTFIESWFIMAPKNSRVVEEIYNEYNTACQIGFNEYRNKVMKEHTFTKDIYSTERVDVYLTVYASIQFAIQKRLKKQVNMILFNSYKTMYKLHHDCWSNSKNDYDSDCIVKKLRDEKTYVKKIPYIKFTKAQYSLMNNIDVKGYFE
jgi:hypothetical protein